jgi:hypothetical protein
MSHERYDIILGLPRLRPWKPGSTPPHDEIKTASVVLDDSERAALDRAGMIQPISAIAQMILHATGGDVERAARVPIEATDAVGEPLLDPAVGKPLAKIIRAVGKELKCE